MRLPGLKLEQDTEARLGTKARHGFSDCHFLRHLLSG